MTTLKEFFKRDKVNGIQVLGPGWFILFTLLVVPLSIWAIIIILVS